MPQISEISVRIARFFFAVCAPSWHKRPGETVCLCRSLAQTSRGDGKFVPKSGSANVTSATDKYAAAEEAPRRTYLALSNCSARVRVPDKATVAITHTASSGEISVHPVTPRGHAHRPSLMRKEARKGSARKSSEKTRKSMYVRIKRATGQPYLSQDPTRCSRMSAKRRTPRKVGIGPLCAGELN